MRPLWLFVAACALSAQPRIVGSGCTTAYYIDLDCDGFGAGRKSGGVYPIGLNDTRGKPGTYTTGDMVDADDADPTVHTTAEWEAKWGGGNAGIIKFLQQRKGFQNTRRVWYISQAGNDRKGKINDPSRPFQSLAPVVAALHDDLKGGVIVIRGGNWGGALNFNACGTNPCFHVTGAANRPVYVIAYPGERVETAGNVRADPAYWPVREVGNVTYDGIIFRAAVYGEGDGVLMNDADHVTFVNCEFAGWHQLFWGNHSEDILVRNNVIHDNMYHAVYFGYFELAHTGPGEFDFDADAAAYRAGKSRGASARCRVVGNVMYNNGDDGYDPIHINSFLRDALIEGNIVSYSGGAGITLQSGVQRSIVRNNVLFDGGNAAITLHVYAPTQSGIRNILIENNTVWVGNPKDSIRRAHPSFGVTFHDETDAARGIKDTVIRNNVFVLYNDGPAAMCAFNFMKNSFPETQTIQNNLIWSSAGKPGPADRVMTIAPNAAPGGRGAGNYNFEQFQAYSPRFTGNRYADPRLADASPSYTLTPERFDLRLLAGSAAIDAGVAPDAGAAPAVDILGRERSGPPDAGAYEYPPAPGVRPVAAPKAVAGQGFHLDLAAEGGAPPYRWSASTPLCEGVTLSPDGALTGTPAAPGVCVLTVQVADSAGKTASRPLAILVEASGAR